MNSLALSGLTEKDMVRGFQITPENPIQSLEGRRGLLTKLGAALDAQPEFFGREVARPGHILDYVLAKSTKQGEVSLKDLWTCVAHGRIFTEHVDGHERGDNSTRNVGRSRKVLTRGGGRGERTHLD